MGSAVYQSTGSLNSDGHSSNSMSPAPSPSPTQALAQSTMKATKISSHHQKIISPTQYATRALLPQRPLSGSLSNLNLSTSRKWNSTSDFREQSQLLNIRYEIRVTALTFSLSLSLSPSEISYLLLVGYQIKVIL